MTESFTQAKLQFSDKFFIKSVIFYNSITIFSILHCAYEYITNHTHTHTQCLCHIERPILRKSKTSCKVLEARWYNI